MMHPDPSSLGSLFPMDLEKALEEDLRRLFENEATRRVDKLIL